MADKPADKNLLPFQEAQNPSPVVKGGQDHRGKVRAQTDRIMQVFLQLLPSNYVSQVQGPFYTMQFQAAAERIAEFQIEAQETWADRDYDFTRSEFLFQILGSMVFPAATTDGFPDVAGDLSYRAFLARMVELLLQGATRKTVEEGLALLSDADFTLTEKGVAARKTPNSAWGSEDAFTFEIDVTEETDGRPIFPVEPFVLSENVRLVMRALKPAHVLYEYRHLFREVFGQLFADTASWSWSDYRYEDFRRFWWGSKSITGTSGATLVDRRLFTDVSRDFGQVVPGADLTITTGPNSIHVGGQEGTSASLDREAVGRYRIDDVLAFPVGTDPVARKYTVTGGLSGKATVAGDAVEDTSQNFGTVVEGAVLTFTEGPNSGTYRLETLLGSNGGSVGTTTGPATRVRVAKSLLRLDRRMKTATSGQSYSVTMDRLGVQEPRVVTAEVVTSQFVGASGTFTSLSTKYGPLVKRWGDGTPATPSDVTVRIDGASVVVASVDPWTGTIRLAVPVAAFPEVGNTRTAVVDYAWQKAPVMILSGLNQHGLVLNKYDMVSGHHAPAAHGEQHQILPGQNVLLQPGVPKGAPDIHRFSMGVVLGPATRRKPLHVGHRYMGFERSYSALVNSPTTLLLNQAPGRVSVPGFTHEAVPTAGAYEAVVAPAVASPPWLLDGTDDGGVDHGQGTYTVDDTRSGAFLLNDPQAVVHHRGVDLSTPTAVMVAARFRVVSTTPDGVFTGVGFGVHDNSGLWFAGALKANGLEHVGLLLDPTRPHEIGSWTIGPKAILTARSQTEGSFVTSTMPIGFRSGSKFQVLTGSQAGAYEALTVNLQSDGTTTVTFDPELPVSRDLYGAKYPEVVFETRTSVKPFTYRLAVNTSDRRAELTIGGEIGGVVATVAADAPALPVPAATSLLLSTGGFGQVFWGSLSRKALSKSTWSFVRYGTTPDRIFSSGHAVTVNTEMQILPENDPDGEWFPVGGFGTAGVEAGTDRLLLKATSEHASVPLTFGYSRTEPFFVPEAILDFRVKFRVDAGTSGAGDVRCEADDTRRLVRLVNLLYREGYAPSQTFRRLITLPVVSMTGFALPESLGWTKSTGNTLSVIPEGSSLVTTQVTETGGGWTKNLNMGSVNFPDEGRILEARLAVKAFTANPGGDTGIRFGCQMPAPVAGNAVVRVELRGGVTPGIRILSSGAVPVIQYDFDWTDGEEHTYRIKADKAANTVTTVVDDTVLLPASTFAAFGGGTNTVETFFGAYGTTAAGIPDAVLTSTVEWCSVSCQMTAPADALRTLGVWLGPETGVTRIDDIDEYEIPRTDSSEAPNSWQTGPVIQTMDWRNDVEVRVYRDPNWGVTVFRPDLPLPPYHQPENGTAGRGFVTESVQPSAGWINVEYGRLPFSVGTGLGRVGFGASDSRSVSQQRWSFVRYRLFRHPTEDRIAPMHMVLNQGNVVTSGERSRDVGLENVVLTTMDKTRLSLIQTHVRAESVYKVVDGSAPPFTSEMWDFDPASQMLVLKTDEETGDSWEFSSDHAAVTVLFVPGKPVTNTYLLSQPFRDIVTRLNEGTPSFPKSQVATAKKIVTGKIRILDVSLLAVGDKISIDGTNLTVAAVSAVDVFLIGASPTLTATNIATALNAPANSFDTIVTARTEGADVVLESVNPGTFTTLETTLTDIGALIVTGPVVFGHEDVPGSLYESLEFFETDDDGDTGLITSYHDETGALELSGTQFWQEKKASWEGDWSQKAGMPGGILFASGGNFVGPVVDGSGGILSGVVALGGTVGPGSAVLMPTSSVTGSQKHTEWDIRMSSVITDTSPLTEVPLTDDLDVSDTGEVLVAFDLVPVP